MEIKGMKIEDIEKRMSEIEAEKVNPEADLEALTEEVRALKEQKNKLLADAEARAKELNDIATGKVETETIKTFEEERKDMKEIEVRNTPEYIRAYAEYIKTGEDKECRALLTENGSGKVAVPELVDEIVRTAWERDDITRLVKKTYIKGNLKVGFEVSATGADVHTEGAAAPSEETLVLGITELVPQSIKKWITISDEALDLTGEAFLRYVYDELTYQIAKKAAALLIADIEACGTVSTNSGSSHLCAVPVVSTASIAMATIATALGSLSDDAANPVVVINKGTLAAFKAVQYAQGYGADPFEGLPVVFNSAVKSFATATTGETFAIVGDFGNGAQMNFPNGEDITFKFDELSLAEKDLVKIVGREFVGHDVVAPNSFVKIQKA
jgi:HK97 family phage major capsid protein